MLNRLVLCLLGYAGPDVRLLTSCQNNQIREFRLTQGEAEVGHATIQELRTVNQQGHRSDVRQVAMSADGESLLTVSAGLVCCSEYDIASLFRVSVLKLFL